MGQFCRIKNRFLGSFTRQRLLEVSNMQVNVSIVRLDRCVNLVSYLSYCLVAHGTYPLIRKTGRISQIFWLSYWMSDVHRILITEVFRKFRLIFSVNQK